MGKHPILSATWVSEDTGLIIHASMCERRWGAMKEEQLSAKHIILSHHRQKTEPLRGFPFSSYEKETSIKWLGGCTFTIELESQFLKQHPAGFK